MTFNCLLYLLHKGHVKVSTGLVAYWLPQRRKKNLGFHRMSSAGHALGAYNLLGEGRLDGPWCPSR